MARWGEGDPRWVVSERTDGQNVNGWHWTEKSYTAWAKERIQVLVTGIASEPDPSFGVATITGLKRMDGEVSISTRKGNKRFVQYDLSVTLSWQGETVNPVSSEAETIKGEVKLAEFANDNDVDDYMFEVTVEGQGQAHDRLKVAMRDTRGEIVERMHQILEELHQK
eukprot:jgi/Mesen1/5097/ME000252S04200